MMRELKFNYICVIQSLPEDETQTGTSLFYDIIDRRTNYQNVGLKSSLTNVIAKSDLIDRLITLEDGVYRKGEAPYIHFELHGCKEGLVLSNKELMRWEELSTILSKINLKIQNNLFVSLATCYGAYIFNGVDPLGRIPFFAFVGPANKVKQYEVEADWEAYFENLLTTKDFTSAINALNQSNCNNQYVFRTSEEIFNLATEGLLDFQKDRKVKRKLIQHLIRMAYKKPGIRSNWSESDLKQFFEKELIDRPKAIQQMKDYFLMKTDMP